MKKTRELINRGCCLLVVLLLLCLAGCRKTEQNLQETKQDTQETEQVTESSSESSSETKGSEEMLYIQIGDAVLTAALEENASVEGLKTYLGTEKKTVAASNYGGFEKVIALDETIVSDDKQITTESGDIMLYNGKNLVVFYDTNSWAYTRIGKIQGMSQEELEHALSGEETEVTIWIR